MFWVLGCGGREERVGSVSCLEFWLEIEAFFCRVSRCDGMGVLAGGMRWLGCMLYPPHCTVCGVGISLERDATELQGRVGLQLCEACAAQVRSVGQSLCFQCSASFSGAVQPGVRCADCLKMPPAFEAAVAAVG